MTPIEAAVVRKCLQEIYRDLGFATQKDIALELENIGSSYSIPIRPDGAKNYIQNQNLNEIEIERISHVAIRILRDKQQTIAAHYEHLESTRDLIYQVLNTHGGTNLPINAGNVDFISTVGRNLRQVFLEDGMVSGVYQTFRRYKPFPDQRQLRPEYRDNGNHEIICELVYIDHQDMNRCAIITAGKNLYWGVCHLNYQNIGYILAQRPANQYPGGIHQRVYSFKLEGMKPAVFSGLCLKTGDQTRRPVCAECLFVLVPESEHKELYHAVRNAHSTKWSHQVISDEIILDYITDIPPLRVAPNPRVKHVKDFPRLAPIIKQDELGLALFREPLRTLSSNNIYLHLSNPGLDVFRHSNHAVQAE